MEIIFIISSRDVLFSIFANIWYTNIFLIILADTDIYFPLFWNNAKILSCAEIINKYFLILISFECHTHTHINVKVSMAWFNLETVWQKYITIVQQNVHVILLLKLLQLFSSTF